MGEIKALSTGYEAGEDFVGVDDGPDVDEAIDLDGEAKFCAEVLKRVEQ